MIKTFNVDEKLYHEMRILTVKQGTSVSAVITKLLKQYLDEHKNETTDR